MENKFFIISQEATAGKESEKRPTHNLKPEKLVTYRKSRSLSHTNSLSSRPIEEGPTDKNFVQAISPFLLPKSSSQKKNARYKVAHDETEDQLNQGDKIWMRLSRDEKCEVIFTSDQLL